jgi:hypothetical protein
VSLFSKWHYYTGKGAMTLHVGNQYMRSPQTGGDKAATAGKLYSIWGQPLTYATAGWAITKVAKNPTSMFVVYSFLAGAYVSSVIDEEEGEANFWGFTSGGLVGNNPNYLSGDENRSGYFNVFGNFATVAAGTATKNKAMLDKAVEQAYIDNYWAEKNWSVKIMLYNGLTQGQKDLVQQKIRSGDYEGASSLL